MDTNSRPVIVSFISGKGAIGKSTILSLLSYVLSDKFSTILIWDNDLHSPIQHILNGIELNVNLIDVLTNNLPTNKALSKITNKIFLIGGANKYKIDIDLSEALQMKFKELLNENHFDIVFVDNHSGFSKSIVDFTKISTLNLLFLSDEPTAVLDAYGLTKILSKYYGINNLATVVNNVIDEEDGMNVSNIFKQATFNFLNLQIPNYGIIPYEKELRKYIFSVKEFLRVNNSSEFLKSLHKLAEKISLLSQQ
ncbi:MAG: hypothetical protein ACK42Z_06265 [Candidatus Kapaibacteriota bacterium]